MDQVIGPSDPRWKGLDMYEALRELIKWATNLADHDARTVMYYAIATHGLPKLQKFPILVLFGGPGSGKSTLLDIVGVLAYQPNRFDGKASQSVLRKQLRENTTALIEEADETHEEWLKNRYSRQASTVTVNNPVKAGRWEMVALNLFGATVLHRSRPYRDAAILSRSIVVGTRRRKGGVPSVSLETFREYRDPVIDAAEDIAWEQIKQIPGRIGDTWAPLLAVASYLGDTEWQVYAKEQMERADEELDQGHQEEPGQAAFLALVALALDVPDGAEPKAQVPLPSVVLKLREDGRDLTGHQVGFMLRRLLGFETGTKGGVQQVFTGGMAKLAAVAVSLGIEDAALQAGGEKEAA